MTVPTYDIAARLRESAERTDRMLADLLRDRPQEQEIARPAGLLAAMRHGTLGGGKRLRPFLVMETAQVFGGDAPAALRVAAALECMHCYSLVHDDLPAMDDDATRRGQPTVHVAFGEAAAILAGDALQTLAFDTIVAPETDLPDSVRVALVLALARASGAGGMAGGQALDLAAETATGGRQGPAEDEIVTLQAMKTGALIRFACEAGALLAEASGADCDRMRRFGEVAGLAFQLADDLLDVTAHPQTLGKATGKDAARGKATLVTRHGVAWTRRRLDGLVAEAIDLLAPYGTRADGLVAAARFIADRQE